MVSLAVAILLGFGIPYAAAEDEAGSESSVTVDLLKARIEEAKATLELDEETRDRAIELFLRAVSALETARSYDLAATEFRKLINDAPTETKQLREKIASEVEVTADPESLVPEDASLETIENRLLLEKANQNALAAKLDELRTQLREREIRPSIARTRTSELRRLVEAQGDRKGPSADEDEDALVLEAEQWVEEAEKISLISELRMLDQELLSHPARVDLLKAQRDAAAINLKQAERRIDLAEALVSQRRRADAEKAQSEAEAVRLETAQKDPLLRGLADVNAKLTSALSERANSLEQLNQEQDDTRAEAKHIEQAFQTTKRRLEIAGLGHALGQALLNEVQELPDLDRLRLENRRRARLIADSQLRLIQYEEDLRALADLDQHANSLLFDLNLDKTRADALRTEIEALLVSKRELLEQAVSTEEAYLRAESEYEVAAGRLLAAAEAYSDYLDEHLLWIRSTPTISLDGLRQLPSVIAGLTARTSWEEVLPALREPDARSIPLLLGLLVAALLIFKRRRLVTAIEATAQHVNRPSMDRIGETYKALALTALYALPFPLIAALLGWRLETSIVQTEFSAGLALTLLWVAPRFYLLSFSLALFLPRCVATQHFRWRAPTVAALRRLVFVLILVFLTADGMLVFLFYYDPVTVGGALGKLTFVVPMIVLVWFFRRVLHPSKGLLESYLNSHRNGMLHRLRYVWFLLLTLIPIGLGVTALAGYLYTASVLFDVFVDSCVLLFLIMIAYQLALRWLRVTRRRLAFKAAMDKRAEVESAITDTGSMSRSGIEIEEPEIDLDVLSEDTHQLIHIGMLTATAIGLWWIWSEVLPAFGLLQGVTLWHQVTVVDGQEVVAAITLANLLLAVAIAVVTYIAATRLPALVEILLLQRISMTAGSRYAITTLGSYFIVAVGALLFFGVIGVDWSKLQWLVAALGVGIGFGLQEIVANFISGLIILFERPVRVGDYVTVGDTSGMVTRIRIRATTITNWDRKELLVPNKEFITGRLLNWSLSDPTTRVVIPVGIAYGSNVDLACKLLSEAADEHELVMSEPVPVVAFEAFADSALSLTLRCYIASVDNRVNIVTDLHKAIDRKFRAAGITIAFPQIDVHLNTVEPLHVRAADASVLKPG